MFFNKINVHCSVVNDLLPFIQIRRLSVLLWYTLIDLTDLNHLCWSPLVCGHQWPMLVETICQWNLLDFCTSISKTEKSHYTWWGECWHCNFKADYISEVLVYIIKISILIILCLKLLFWAEHNWNLASGFSNGHFLRFQNQSVLSG